MEWLDREDEPSVEPIRRNADPVNANHDFQRRTENAMNRQRREARKAKEKNQ